MTGRETIRRLLSLIAQVPLKKIDAATLSAEEYDRVVAAGKELSSLPIYVPKDAA